MGDRDAHPTRRALLAASTTPLIAGCGMLPNDDTESPDDRADSNQAGGTDDGEPPTSPLESDVEPEPLVLDLEVPWDLAFAPTGELYLTERPGRLTRLETDAVLAGGDPLDAGALSRAHRQEWPGQSMLGVDVHPSYPEPPFVYVYYNRNGENRVGRFDARATDPQDTLTDLVAGIAGDHTIGGRLAFGPDGDLWITVGTAAEDPAEDPGSLGGTIMRVTPAGEPSPANPTIDGADPRVYTYGHRNPQGLAWLPDGTPMCTDHGPAGRDEVAVLRAGANYGWPDVRGGPDDPAFESYAAREDIVPPVVNTGPEETWAPCGAVGYSGAALPSWRDRVLVATLRGRHLAILTLLPPGAEQPPVDGRSRRYDAGWLDDQFIATAHRVIENELGRIRHVTVAPDGSVLVATSNRDGAPGPDERFPREDDDAIVRLRAA